MLANNDGVLDEKNIWNNYIPQIYRKRLHEANKTKSSDCSYCKLELGKRLKSIIYCADCRKHLHPQCFVAFHKKYVYNKIWMNLYSIVKFKIFNFIKDSIKNF